MIMISSRQNFWSSTEIADTDQIRNVQLLNPDPSVDPPMTEPQYLNSIKNQRVLILVHGYNNDEDDVNRAYDLIEKQIAALIPGQYDRVVGYTWPGGNLRLSYPRAKSRAKASSPRFHSWLRKSIGKARSVDVMAHSLGNLVTLRALSDLAQEPGPRVRNCYLLAAAVDNESIEAGEKYFDGTRQCDRVYVMHSKRDEVLKLLYPAGESISFSLPDVALGLSGPEDVEDVITHSKHVKVANCKEVVDGHGKYKECAEMYLYIQSELTGPPAEQFATIRPSAAGAVA